MHMKLKQLKNSQKCVFWKILGDVVWLTIGNEFLYYNINNNANQSFSCPTISSLYNLNRLNKC